MRSPLPFAFAALALLAAAPARADVTFPGQAPDTCTKEKQFSADKECYECRAYYGNPEHCSASLASLGFGQQCRGRGASAWGEIWCRPKATSTPKVPPNVLAQLADPVNGIKPSPSATPATPPAPPPPTPSVPPSASAPPPPAPAPADTASPAPPAPPPTPPPQGCACSVGEDGTGPLAASLLTFVAAAVIAWRRRRGA